MSDNGDNFNSDGIKSSKNNHNAKLTTEEDNGVVSEPNLNFLRLISIFESEESDSMSNHSSQKRSTAATEAMVERDPGEHVNGEPAEEAVGPSNSNSRSTEIVTAGTASGVAVTNRGAGSWTVSRPERNLLVVIHPWCMLRKSSADRQSEFPPPGFLELLKAKLLQAIHRETDRGQHRPSPAADVCKRRRDNGGSQAIKCWFRYNAAAAFRGQRTKSIAATTTSYPDGPAVFDFLTIRRRFAAPRDTRRSSGGARSTVPSTS